MRVLNDNDSGVGVSRPILLRPNKKEKSCVPVTWPKINRVGR